MACKRLLVIANETIAGAALHEHIRELTADDGHVVIVAPALSSRLKYAMSDIDGPRHDAQRRLDRSLELLRESGISAEGEVGDTNPLRAFLDAVVLHDPDGVLISTHPKDRSWWLERGEVERIRARTDLPVEHVVVDLPAQQAESQLSDAA